MFSEVLVLEETGHHPRLPHQVNMDVQKRKKPRSWSAGFWTSIRPGVFGVLDWEDHFLLERGPVRVLVL